MKRIFELAASGVTPYRISVILKKEAILKPRAKMMQDLGKYVSLKFVKYPCDWASQTIFSILKNREYLGHLVCNRNTSKSYKERKLILVPEEDWIIVKNTHEAIIDEQTFELVQKRIVVKRDSKEEILEPQMFIGLLRCDTCGATIGYAKEKSKKGNGAYSCTTYRRYGKTYCSMHYISYDNLYNVVLNDIRKHSEVASINLEKLLSELSQNNDLKNKKALAQSEKEIIKTEKRIEELNLIIKRLYEDNILGKLTDERFSILSKDYENEQKSLRETALTMKNSIYAFTEIKCNMEKFAISVQKYTDITELNATILNELIDKIIIHQCEYLDGKRKQQIDIYYNFVGII